MSRFLTPLQLEYAGDGSGQKEVIGAFRYRSDVPEVKRAYLEGVVEVEHGFRTDLASVPRLPFAYWFFGGVGDGPAVVHDKLYTDGKVSRKAADEVFSEALKDAGVGALRRGPMWLGVRLFGGSHYAPAPAEAA